MHKIHKWERPYDDEALKQTTEDCQRDIRYNLIEELIFRELRRLSYLEVTDREKAAILMAALKNVGAISRKADYESL